MAQIPIAEYKNVSVKKNKIVKFENLFNEEERHSMNQMMPPEVTSFIKSEVADQIEIISETFNNDYHDYIDINDNNSLLDHLSASDFSFKLDEDGLCKIKIRSEEKSKSKRISTKNKNTKQVKFPLEISVQNTNSTLNNTLINEVVVMPNKQNSTLKDKETVKIVEKYFSCKYQNCLFSVVHPNDLQKHYLEKHGGFIFACAVCPFMTIDKQALGQHQSNLHGPAFFHQESSKHAVKCHASDQTMSPNQTIKTILICKLRFTVKFQSCKRNKQLAIKNTFGIHISPNRKSPVVSIIGLTQFHENTRMLPLSIRLNGKYVSKIKESNNNDSYQIKVNTPTRSSSLNGNYIRNKTDCSSPCPQNDVQNCLPTGQVKNSPPMALEVHNYSQSPAQRPKLEVHNYSQMPNNSSSAQMPNNSRSPINGSNKRKFNNSRESERRNENKKAFEQLKVIIPKVNQMERPSRQTILTKANEHVHFLQNEYRELTRDIVIEKELNMFLKKKMEHMNKC